MAKQYATVYKMQITVYTVVAPCLAMPCHSNDPRTCRKRCLEMKHHSPARTLLRLTCTEATKRPERARVNGPTPLPAATALFQPLLRTINGSRAGRAARRRRKEGTKQKVQQLPVPVRQSCRWPPRISSCLTKKSVLVKFVCRSAQVAAWPMLAEGGERS